MDLVRYVSLPAATREVSGTAEGDLASGEAIARGTYLNLLPLTIFDAPFHWSVSDYRLLPRMLPRVDLAITKRCIYQRKCPMRVANEEVRNDAGERDSEQRSNSDEQ
jgi:hypothetical protein